MNGFSACLSVCLSVGRSAGRNAEWKHAVANMKDAGFDVQARAPCQKPMRQPEHEELRVDVCKHGFRKPKKFFPKKVDMLMDHKCWAKPSPRSSIRFNKVRAGRA